MDQHKTVDFSIIKQKIIKTDEVLKMYVDVSNKLKKTQQTCKELKLLYDQTLNNLSRIQLEYDRCKFNIDNVRQKNEMLDKENKELQEQKLVLEEKYNQQTVQSQLNIKYLEDELKMLNDIRSTTESWSPKKKRATCHPLEKKHEKVGIKKEKMLSNNHKDVANGTGLSSHEGRNIGNHLAINDITNSSINEGLVNEYSDLNISHSKKIDYSHLQDIGIQTCKFVTEKRNIHTQTVETLDSMQLHDTTFTKYNELKQRIAHYDAEIIKLKNIKYPVKKSCSTQTDDEVEIDDEFVKYILREMSIPTLLSPLSPSKYKHVITPISSVVPEVIVTSPEPVVETNSNQLNSFEEHDHKNLSVDRVNITRSEVENVCTESRTFTKKCKYKSTVVRNSFVKLRKMCLSGLIKKRGILNKEIRKIKKLRRQDNLLKSLCALKESKINFTISNDSVLPTFYKNQGSMGFIKGHHLENICPPLQKFEQQCITEQLNCLCKTCNQSNMLLSVEHGDTQLLGFYTVKNETSTQANSRMDVLHCETKLFDPMKLIKSSFYNSNLTPEGVLEVLAEMVSRKLSAKEKNITKRKIINSNHSDTFATETETEIEKLFNESKNDILKRNKMLLETAKKQNQKNLSPQDFGSNSDTIKKRCISFDSDISSIDEQVLFTQDCVPIADLANTSDDGSNDDYNFELFSCPAVISPIKSIKKFDISKRDHNHEQLMESSKTILVGENEQIQCNTFESSSPLLNGVNKISDAETAKKHIEHNNISGTNCLTSSSNVSIGQESTNMKILDEEESFIFAPEKAPPWVNSPAAVKKEITFYLKEKNCAQLIEHDFCPSNNVKVNVNENSAVQSLPDCPDSPVSSNIHNEIELHILIPLETSNAQVGEKCDVQSLPDCPDSPVPSNTHTEIELPILIPLETSNSQGEKCENKFDQQNTPFSPIGTSHTTSRSVAVNRTQPSQTRRRSKRISEKKLFSQTSKCLSSTDDIKHLEKMPDEVPENIIERLSPLCDNNGDGTSLIEQETEHLSNNGNLNNNRETTSKVPNTKKRVSKLKSKILNQVRVRRQIFRNVESHTLKPNENKLEGKDGELETANKNKICIVQNILIPANSNHVVDLMKGQEGGSSEAEYCDIRLDSGKSSSQDSTVPLKTSSNRKKSSDCVSSVVPTKKRCVANKKNDCDVLSKIIGEMDKDRPKVVVKPNMQTSISRNILHDSADEKQWRKGVLVIAEDIHNTLPKAQDLMVQEVNKQTTYNPKCKNTVKRKILLTRLLKLSNEETIPDEIVLEFKRLDLDSIAEIVLQKVSEDIHDKPDDKYYPAPLMTRTQRILLGLMVRLERDNVEKVMDTFLSKAEAFLFKIGCGIRTVIPITRLYMAVCKLRRDINKMRQFCCSAFLFMADLAVPLYFTVLTSWTEVLPKESSIESYPIAKVLFQVVHLKTCNKPGYNLIPLKSLFSQFYGYPTERYNCDEIFDEFYQRYLKNPDKSSDIAIRLICRNKDSKWIHKKINECFIPLIYKIPLENVNFKATVIILIGNICRSFKPNNEFDESSLKDMRRWLVGLTEDENVHDLIIKSVDLSLGKLPKKKSKAKKSKPEVNQRVIQKQKKGRKKKKCKRKTQTIVK